MFLGFLLCSYSPCQAAKQQTVEMPRCQAVKQPSCNCCASKLSNCKAHTVASCKASLPSSQAVHLLLAHLVVLFLSCCIQAATYTNMWVHFWADPDPDPDRSRPDPSIQTTFSPVLKRVIVWVLSFLQLLVRNPLTLELMSKVARVLTVKLNPKCEHCTWSSRNRSLHLSM